MSSGMIKRSAGVAAICTSAVALSAVQVTAGVFESSTVFTSGESGYTCIRIPTIIKANNGMLLAFAQGKYGSCSDFADSDMILKRSTDGGRTWGPLQVLDTNGTGVTGGACPVVDAATGTIVVPFMRDAQPYLMRSTNNGAFWTGPFPLASQVFSSEWSAMGFGPVHGIQLQNGPNAGRLVIPCKSILADQNLEPDGRESHVVYSDDGGVTWAIGGSMKNPNAGFGPNESTVVELNDGSLYLSARNQGGGSRHRLVGFSPDGIQDFDGDPNDGINSSVVDTGLVDAQVQGSLLRASADRIIHSHVVNDTTDRYHLTISSSFDEAQSWSDHKLIHRTRTAYSDLVVAQGGEIGVMYETGTYTEIRFGWFDESWLDDTAIVHYDFSTANFASDGGVNKFRSTSGFDYDAQALSFVTHVAGSQDYEGDGAIRFSLAASGDTLRMFDATADSNLEFEHEDSFTIEAVFNTSNHDTNVGVILDKSETGNSNGEFSLEVENSKVKFHLRDLNGLEANLLSSIDVNDGLWHHVAAVRDANEKRLYLYVDHQFAGTVVDQTTADFGDIAFGQAEVPIIGSDAQGLFQFGGDLQHLKISMAALAPDQFLQKLNTGLVGDLNGDGYVGLDDLDIVLSHWNLTVPPGDAAADPTGDGFVGLDDLDIVLNNWNTGTPPTFVAIPEPGTTTCLFLTTVLISYWRSQVRLPHHNVRTDGREV